MKTTRRFRLLSLAVVILAIGAGFLGGGATFAAPAAGVAGNTFTSPTFGYTLTWPDTWFVAEEKTDRSDLVVVTNGITYAHFIGENAFAGNAQAALAAMVAVRARDDAVSNFQPLSDSAGNTIRGGDATRAFAAFTFTVTFENGNSVNLAEYVETRTLIPGRAVLIIFAYHPVEFWESERPLIDELLTGLVIPGQGATTTTGQAEQPQLVAGEPAPVYVSGPWRVAVAVVSLNDEHTAVDLRQKNGKEWLVVIADVTNWSDKGAAFDAREFTVRITGSRTPTVVAPASTRSVARQLKLAPVEPELQIAIPAGETRRVVLVYAVPAGSSDPALIRDRDALPLFDALERDLDVEDLPPLAGPPRLSRGTIVAASDGATLRVQLPSKDSANRVRLLGVIAPDKGGCYAGKAKERLGNLIGKTVLLERDEAVTGGSVTVRYVWVENEDGTRSLLNQQVIAEGMGRAASLPADARFGAWLAESERVARDEAAGQWKGCALPEASPVASPVARAM